MTVHPTINYVPTVLDNKAVMLTTAYHLRKLVNEANGMEILTSNFYYDIIEEKQYLKGDDFVIRDFQARYPVKYAQVSEDLRKAGITRGTATHFLTPTGVFNILYAYGIEPATLLRGGVKIPLKQDKLFAKKELKQEVKIEHYIENLFETGQGLTTAPQAQPATAPVKGLKPNYRVYVRGYENIEEQVIIGMNHVLSKAISTFPLVRHHLDNKTGALYAQIYVTPNAEEDKRQVKIRFVEPKTEHSLAIRRSAKDGYLTNVSLRKSHGTETEGVMQALKNFKLESTDTRDILLVPEYETIIANF